MAHLSRTNECDSGKLDRQTLIEERNNNFEKTEDVSKWGTTLVVNKKENPYCCINHNLYTSVVESVLGCRLIQHFPSKPQEGKWKFKVAVFLSKFLRKCIFSAQKYLSGWFVVQESCWLLTAFLYHLFFVTVGRLRTVIHNSFINPSPFRFYVLISWHGMFQLWVKTVVTSTPDRRAGRNVGSESHSLRDLKRAILNVVKWRDTIVFFFWLVSMHLLLARD